METGSCFLGFNQDERGAIPQDGVDSGLDIDPTDAVAYAGRAIVLRRLGRDDESDRDLEHAVENGYDRAQLERAIAENA